jgi:hypothetical protein
MVLAKAGKRALDLANLYGCSKQSMSMKMTRESWFAKDLIKVAEFTGCKLAFVYPDGTTIYIDGQKEEALGASPPRAEE